MPISQSTVDSYFERALDEYKSNPVARKLLRQLADEMPAQFFTRAVCYLESHEGSEAERVLTVLLMHPASLFEFIAEPSQATRERAASLVRRILHHEPSFDVRLARQLPDRSGQNHKTAFHGVRGARIVEVLDEVSVGRRLLPVLYHLVDSTDSKLSERATLFVGRRVRTPEWATRQLRRPDARGRANAVESIWGVDHPEVIKLLEGCVNDSNNRVVGNALMGLYLLNRPGVDGLIPGIAVHGKPEFRSTAAWMMGKLARPEFTPALKILLSPKFLSVKP